MDNPVAWGPRPVAIVLIGVGGLLMALACLVLAKALKPHGWAAPLTARWMALEVLYCLCVLMLMSAASLGEVADDEAAAS